MKKININQIDKCFKYCVLSSCFFGFYGLSLASDIDLSYIQQKNESELTQAITSNNIDNIKLKNQQDLAKFQDTQSSESVIKSNNNNMSKVKMVKTTIPDVPMTKYKFEDINSLVKQQVANLKSTNNGTGGVGLYISFTSMPEETIITYAKQAQKYKIPFVLRGFVNNNYQDTIAYINKLRKEKMLNVDIMIDPPAYDKYSIKEVPALVVTSAKTNPMNNGCEDPKQFTKVSGEVSINALLNYVAHNSDNKDIQNMAQKKLNEVRDKSFFKVN